MHIFIACFLVRKPKENNDEGIIICVFGGPETYENQASREQLAEMGLFPDDIDEYNLKCERNYT